jgi:hypothetical protein
MTPALEERLVRRYPNLFSGRTLPTTESMMSFGCDHGNGWYQIIDAVCAVLSAYDDRVVFRQIKEKTSSLRIRYIGGDDAVRGATSYAEHMSESFCEHTGRPVSCTRIRRGAAHSPRVASATGHRDWLLPGVTVGDLRRHAVLDGPIDLPPGWIDVADGLLWMMSPQWDWGETEQKGPPLVKVTAIYRSPEGLLLVQANGVDEQQRGMIACACELAIRVDPDSGELRSI